MINIYLILYKINLKANQNKTNIKITLYKISILLTNILLLLF